MGRSGQKNLRISLKMAPKSYNLEFISRILKSKEIKIVVSINYGKGFRILRVNRSLQS